MKNIYFIEHKLIFLLQNSASETEKGIIDCTHKIICKYCIL